MLDLGANASCTPEQLRQFAVDGIGARGRSAGRPRAAAGGFCSISEKRTSRATTWCRRRITCWRPATSTMSASSRATIFFRQGGCRRPRMVHRQYRAENDGGRPPVPSSTPCARSSRASMLPQAGLFRGASGPQGLARADPRSPALQWREHGGLERHRDQEPRRHRSVRISARHRSRGGGSAQWGAGADRTAAERVKRSLEGFMYARIAGTGSYLPEKILTNADLEKLVETSDEWIRTRTGIERRHVAAEGETTTDPRGACLAPRDGGRRRHRGRCRFDLRGHHDARSVCFPTWAPCCRSAWGFTVVRHSAWRRPAPGFVYALGVADKFVRLGRIEMRTGRRSGDADANRRLERSGHLRAVRGWSRRGDPQTPPSNPESSAPACIRTENTRICCCIRTAYPRDSPWYAKARPACR